MKMRLVAFILVFVAVLILFRLYHRRVRASSVAARQADPNVDMPTIAEDAVRFAAVRGKTLDFRPDSVNVVESVLSDLHIERAKGQLSDSDVNMHAVQFGAYIGEVLRRTYGGSWSIDHPVAGPRTFPIHWNGHDSFPVGWCGKRILNGDEDNVWFKFQVLTSDQGESGTKTKDAVGPTTSE